MGQATTNGIQRQERADPADYHGTQSVLDKTNSRQYILDPTRGYGKEMASKRL
jgi:hypothetical protein